MPSEYYKEQEEFPNLKAKLAFLIEKGAEVDGHCHGSLTTLSYFLKVHQKKNDWKLKIVQDQLSILLELEANPTKVPLEIFSELPFNIQDQLLESINTSVVGITTVINNIAYNVGLGLETNQKIIWQHTPNLKTVLSDVVTETKLILLLSIEDNVNLSILRLRKSFTDCLIKCMNQVLNDSEYLNNQQKIKDKLKEIIQTWRATMSQI